ncbi:RRM1_TatSF1_like and RRM2_TatSF1_like domain-containing protein barc isoform X1 [Osmia lignaria lignaria]|uniref:RRM1_TatSF1_like and RRM2_TatSF1_like domain-containing protein barc isoform X1 n=1 Tax=Osmia lignaria lignaria TaxID=1437193 RepID=UPI00147930FD|nr:HIV Tat-specific factor 1 homolog [Osmia lignaria]XP_034190730.1 HIV Tat-specific factor 1 homolog [Osmia lignaria]
MADCQEQEKPDDPMKLYEFDGESYIYKDPTTNVTYRFDQEKNEWVEKKTEETKGNDSSTNEAKPQEGVFGFENDTHTYTDPNDGSVYFWDKEKNAWFPKVDDDFMARYQMSYGFTDSSTTETKPVQQPETKKAEKEKRKVEAKRKAQEPPTWFEVDEAHNTAIYVSGLPLDITLPELTELFSKCGLIARDEKGKDKIKLYRDSNGQPKGDALCIYIKVESVDLALKILDKSQLRGKTLSVQRAKFQMKGEAYDPALKPKRKKKDKERQKKIHEKLFDWRPERPLGEPGKHEKVVIIKNLFSPEDFDKEVALLLEYQQDIRSECLKCGDVRKVVIYDRHPEGVAQVTFREPAEAQACVQLLNGRWFSQRKISAEIWDGKTKYKVTETDAEIEARIAKWDKFLEGEEEKKEAAARNEQRSNEKSMAEKSEAFQGKTELPETTLKASAEKTEASNVEEPRKKTKTADETETSSNSDDSDEGDRNNQ